MGCNFDIGAISGLNIHACASNFFNKSNDDLISRNIEASKLWALKVLIKDDNLYKSIF